MAGDGPFVFPHGFQWGTATADHQIERAQPDDWTAFELSARADRKQTQTRLGLVPPGHIADIATVPASWIEKKADFDAHFDDDLGRATRAVPRPPTWLPARARRGWPRGARPRGAVVG